MRTVEAYIDEHGVVHLRHPVKLNGACRAIVTILDDQVADERRETTVLSEPSLAEDWNRPEEDAAWSHLQPDR